MDLRHLLGEEQAEATVRRLLLVRIEWTAQTGDHTAGPPEERGGPLARPAGQSEREAKRKALRAPRGAPCSGIACVSVLSRFSRVQLCATP